ncbi:MAG: heavy-metal-associated domain-containing protein [Actinomycetota bacterium]|nr:heavy-metal-associated domain-containing protein [Actinomycetota bacterium]
MIAADQREADMPDVTLVVRDLSSAEDAEKLERALERLDPVRLVNVDSEKGLVAVSYEGGDAELNDIRQTVEGTGHEADDSPGASSIGD